MKIVLLVLAVLAVILSIIMIRRDQKQRQLLTDSLLQRLELESDEFASLPEEAPIPPRIE